jgi:DNA replication and repair protein RecF
MRIGFIKIKGFRNLKPLKLSFDEKKSVFAFVGPNGHGKTNLLEAIYLCALSKSFRTRTSQDVISFDNDFCDVKCKVDDKELNVIITNQPVQKVLKINDVKKNASDFIGVLKAVFFSPDDLSEMAFAPRLRRRYMDVLLSQLDHEYLNDLIKYQDVIRQRNALLKKIKEGKAKIDELDFWDEQLVELGFSIIEKRSDLIKQLTKSVQKLYKDISQTKDELTIKYQSSCDGIMDKQKFSEYLTANRDRDVASGVTQSGPHRDDLQFLINGHDMVFFASRGEWRSLVLALKFAEIQLIEKKTGDKPVLLLDDVFSELDEVRQKYLFEAIKNTQTFITTTHKEFLEGVGGGVDVFKVESGIVG